MTGRRVAVATAGAAALVALAVLLEVVLPRAQQRRRDERTLLLPQGAQLDAFEIDRAGERMSFRRRADGSWSVEAPGRPALTADARAVNLVGLALAGTRVTSEVGPAEGAPLASYGLDPPRARLRWARPGGEPWDLGLGSPALGGQAHALLAGRIVLVPERVLQAADNGLDHFRAKRLLALEADDVASVEVVRRKDALAPGASERLVLERMPSADEDASPEWRMTAPRTLLASSVRMASLLSKLAALESLGFGAEQPQAADLAGAGLAQPTVSVTLTLRDGRRETVAIGDPSPDRHAWARVGDGPLAEVREDLARELLLPDDFWRDTRIAPLPAWRLLNVKLRKGLQGQLDLEIAREPGGPWRVVRPTDAPLSAGEAKAVLDALDEIECGRFEDALAQDEARLQATWNFDAPGSLTVEAFALLSDGTPRTARCELTPISHERRPYFAVRTTDGMGSVTACVVEVRKVDALIEKARAVARAAASSAP